MEISEEKLSTSIEKLKLLLGQLSQIPVVINHQGKLIEAQRTTKYLLSQWQILYNKQLNKQMKAKKKGD